MTARTRGTVASGGGPLAGTWRLLWLVVRTARAALAVWVVVTVGVLLMQSSALGDLLPTQAARDAFAAASNANAVARSVLGHLDAGSLADVVVWRASPQSVLVAGIASVLLVIR